jgi:glycosyltransferase involved in cell wall biosynthesis
MPPLRILHVTPYSADAWAYGGIPRVTGALTRGLARLGHHVTVCATDACTATSRLPRLDRPIGTRANGPRPPSGPGGVELQIFPNLSNRLAYHAQLFMPRGLRAFLREHAGRFDVAHLHACRNLPGAFAAAALDRAGVPYVLAPNGTAPLLERRLWPKRAFDLIAGRRMLRHAARVLAVSSAEVRQLATCHVDAARIHHIPNPLDLEEFSATVPRGLFRHRFALGDVPLVLFLGKITPRKRVDVLVRAFASLARPRAHLVIAGNDMGGLETARGLVAQHGLDTSVTFTGLLCGTERLQALTDADVVVYASEDEVFGLVPLEALLCGTPVAVADDCGCGEIVSALGGQHVLAAGDAPALTRAMADILDHPDRARAAAAAAGDRVKASYGGDVVAARMVDLYRQIVRERCAG